MGKSKKKVKAEQITILRKQYDAFLEEDKKRKERNECILEKLDQIRLSNTVTRYKSNVYFDHRVPFKSVEETQNTYTHQQGSNVSKQTPSVNSVRKYKEAQEIDLLPKTLDEKYIINEISKKYILIPKLRSIVNEDYNPRGIRHDNNNDYDWKSKYSILDKLKQNEKEESLGYSALNNRNERFLDDIPSKEPKYPIDERDITQVKPDRYPKSQNVEAEGMTKLYCPTVNFKTDQHIETGMQSDISPTSNSHSPRTLQPNAEFTNIDGNTNIIFKDVKEPHQHQTTSDSTASEINASDYTYPTHEQAVSKNIDDEHHDPTYDKHENEASEKDSLSLDESSHVKVFNSSKLGPQEINAESIQIGAPETAANSIDTINAQELTPAENTTLVDENIHINPDGYELQQEYSGHSHEFISAPVPEQAYMPDSNQAPNENQYVTQLQAVAEPHIPEGLRLTDAHYTSGTTPAEQAYLPGIDHTPDGNQYVLKAVSAEQNDMLGTNVQGPTRDQFVSEPVVEQIDSEIANTGHEIINEGHNPTMTDTMASEMEAFEEEQNQMFYSEQTNYQDYNQDPDAAGAVYNAENTGYDQDYYQQQEGAYPVEINEHEETAQPYDPSYEQQYAGTEQGQYAEPQHYDQQQYDEQQYQQYAEQQQYNEQHYPEQYGGQLQGELNVNSVAQGYDQGQSGAVQEQLIQQVQQELDNEDVNQSGVADVTDSIFHVEAPTEEHEGQQETPQAVS